VKFLTIFTSNLDEFFMKRVSILRKGQLPEHETLLVQIRVAATMLQIFTLTYYTQC
jgi:polyphosphate kinase